MGLSLLHTGDVAEGRDHLDHAIALYDPAEHRHLGDAVRSGRRRGKPLLEVDCVVAARLSRGRARRRRARPRDRAREPTLCDTDLRAEFQRFSACLLRELRGGKCAHRRIRPVEGSNRVGVLGRMGNGAKRLRIDPDREGYVKRFKTSPPVSPKCAQQGPRCGCRCFCHIWRRPTQKSVNSIRPGPTFAKR